MLEAVYDDGHDWDGYRRDARDGDLSPRHFHLRCAWDRGGNQISAVLIVRWPSRFAVAPPVCPRVSDVLIIDIAVRRIADLVLGEARARRILERKRITSGAFFIGLLAGAGLTIAALHQVDKTHPDLALAITLYPVTMPAGQIAVLTVAVAVLIGFLLW